MSDDKKQVQHKVAEQEEICDEFGDLDDLDVASLIPSLGSVAKDAIPEKPECIVKDDVILGLYEEILQNCRQDREKTDEILINFLDMVMNDGEATAPTKEAVVNLMKIKSDVSDKMTKIADLMTRIKLKDNNTMPRWLAAQQNNKVIIEGDHRSLIKKVTAAQKKGEK